ncbi:MAG: hypothetical protein KDB14_04475 [Planctomycetales bacterium]|nr:hypothetical protein [Planctomycetales bacterium]
MKLTDDRNMSTKKRGLRVRVVCKLVLRKLLVKTKKFGELWRVGSLLLRDIADAAEANEAGGRRAALKLLQHAARE